MYDKASVAASVKENTEVLYFASVEEAIENLATFVKKDDTVLIKASNGMKFNRILEALTSDENANKFEKREEKLFSQIVVETKDEDLIDSRSEGKRKCGKAGWHHYRRRSFGNYNWFDCIRSNSSQSV